MTELADKIEAAEASEQREMLLAAFDALYPEPAPDCEPHWRPENPKQPIYHAWKTRQTAFIRFIDAEAYESAAMTLVPEGGFGSLIAGLYPDGSVGFAAVVNKPGRGDTQAATPALALAAAALRAGDTDAG